MGDWVVHCPRYVKNLSIFCGLVTQNDFGTLHFILVAASQQLKSCRCLEKRKNSCNKVNKVVEIKSFQNKNLWEPFPPVSALCGVYPHFLKVLLRKQV